MNSKTALLLAAAAATASALTATQEKQLDIIFADVGANLNEYIGLVSDPSSGITLNNLPAGLMDVGEKVALNPSDTSYTSDYSEVDMAGVSSFVTMLSWYSSRLAPKLDAAGVPIAGETTTTSSSSTAATTSATPSTTSTAVTTTSTSSSSVAETTAIISSSSSSSPSPSSSSSSSSSSSAAAAETTVSSSAAFKTTATTLRATAQAISQISDGQIQATVAISQQTANGAAKAVAGLGAGAIAAAALLL